MFFSFDDSVSDQAERFDPAIQFHSIRSSWNQVMPSFSVTVNHALTREEAVARLRDYSARLETEYGEHVSQIQKAWDDHGNMNFKFKAMGFSINGDMIAGDSQVTIRGSLPFLAVPLRGMIEQQVAQRLRDALQEA